MYFSKFPLRYYELQEKRYLIPDIINRVMFTEYAKRETDIFLDYIIKDGDSPQKIASVVYGSSVYDWVIFLFNDIYDFFEDWPMDDAIFNEYVVEKYGQQNLHNIHHYENGEGEIVSSTHPAYDRNAVENYTYEQNENDKKRRIRFIKPMYLQRVVKEFEELMND